MALNTVHIYAVQSYRQTQSLGQSIEVNVMITERDREGEIEARTIRIVCGFH